MVTSKQKSISFFCPAYNDEGNLPDLIPQVVNFLKKNFDAYEIFIIDDGAKDNTGLVADELALQYPHITVVHHQKNKGYSATLKEGFQLGKYEWVMYTDGDNQYDVHDVEDYLYLLDDSDLICGYATKKAVSLGRRIQSFVFNTLINMLFQVKFKDINCSVKIIKKEVLDNIQITSSPYGAFVDAELVLKAHQLQYKIKQFPVVHYERKSGVASGSKPYLVLYTLKDMIKLRFGIS